jgi:hypothetical protein
MRSPRGVDIGSELAELARSRMREVKQMLKIFLLKIIISFRF